MRVVLGIFVLCLAVLSPAPGVEYEHDGMGILRTIIVPALSPLVFLVLMLDVLMSRVKMIESDADTRRTYRTIIIYNVSMAALLVISWMPYFFSLTF